MIVKSELLGARIYFFRVGRGCFRRRVGYFLGVVSIGGLTFMEFYYEGFY